MENKVMAPKVEGSTELVVPQKNVDIVGLNEVPTSIIPIPFYKLVQPGSTNVTLNDGQEAASGSIFLRDSGMAIDSLEFYLLRAKRQVQDMTRDDGTIDRVTRIGMLGMTKGEFLPFLMSVPISSFPNFGRMIKQLQERKTKKAWEYSIVATTEKVETKKVIKGRLQQVKFWIFNFAVSEKKVDKKVVAVLEQAFKEFGGALDREIREEEKNREEPKPLAEAADEVINGEPAPF